MASGDRGQCVCCAAADAFAAPSVWPTAARAAKLSFRLPLARLTIEG